MKILVTGGCGFIGSNFIEYVLSKDDSALIANIDALTYAGDLKNTKTFIDSYKYSFFKENICNTQSIDKIFELFKPEVVVNFAAETHVDNSIEDSSEFVKSNVQGVQVLLDASRKHGVGRFIQISTDEVYGSTKKGSFKENGKLNPSSPYSAAKAGGELLALSYLKTHKVPVIITRSSNNYGPRQHEEKLIPTILSRLSKGEKVPIYGDGTNQRDWIYVEDNCAAIYRVLKEGKVGEIYNIGTEQFLSNNDVAKEILTQSLLEDTWIEYVQDRPGHDFRYAIDCSKIRDLGWLPSMDFPTGILKTLVYYRNILF